MTFLIIYYHLLILTIFQILHQSDDQSASPENGTKVKEIIIKVKEIFLYHFY